MFHSSFSCQVVFDTRQIDRNILQVRHGLLIFLSSCLSLIHRGHDHERSMSNDDFLTDMSFVKMDRVVCITSTHLSADDVTVALLLVELKSAFLVRCNRRICVDTDHEFWMSECLCYWTDWHQSKKLIRVLDSLSSRALLRSDAPKSDQVFRDENHCCCHGQRWIDFFLSNKLPRVKDDSWSPLSLVFSSVNCSLFEISLLIDFFDCTQGSDQKHNYTSSKVIYYYLFTVHQ